MGRGGPHDHAEPAAAAAGDHDLVARPHHPVGTRGLAVDVDLPPAAGALRLGPRLEEAGDVEPEVEPLRLRRDRNRLRRALAHHLHAIATPRPAPPTPGRSPA